VKKLFLVLLLFLSLSALWSQETDEEDQQELQVPEERVVKDSLNRSTVEMYDPLKPSRAGFYSAILPGLGQAYNKDYWKIPLVYGALGTGTYSAVYNQQRYDKYRTAYKLLLRGEENDYPGISAETLQSAQEYHKNNRDLSLLVTAGLYLLQIVEASVDAHLSSHTIDDNLSFTPVVIPSLGTDTYGFGAQITYQF
jgi:hypothetical protein